MLLAIGLEFLNCISMYTQHKWIDFLPPTQIQTLTTHTSTHRQRYTHIQLTDIRIDEEAQTEHIHS